MLCKLRCISTNALLALVHDRGSEPSVIRKLKVNNTVNSQVTSINGQN